MGLCISMNLLPCRQAVWTGSIWIFGSKCDCLQTIGFSSLHSPFQLPCSHRSPSLVHTVDCKVRHPVGPGVSVAVRQLEESFRKSGCLPGLLEQVRLLLLGLQCWGKPEQAAVELIERLNNEVTQAVSLSSWLCPV